MSCKIRPAGEAVFKMAGNQIRVPCDLLKASKVSQISAGRTKDDDEDLDLVYRVTTPEGTFEWGVLLSSGTRGASMTEHYLISSPHDAEMIMDIRFEEIDVE